MASPRFDYVATGVTPQFARPRQSVRANLSFAADAYTAAGGFRPVRCHEDVLLVDALEDAGEPITWATDLCVLTSARRDGRAPNGFADYLTSLEDGVGSEEDRTAVPRAM